MGWPLVRLDSLYKIARGGSPRPIKNFITDDPNGVNWIKIGDATASGKYIYETKERISSEGIQRSRLVKEGDFILSNSMSFGRPYIMATTGCIHDGWLVLSPKDESIDQEFLYHLLGSPFVFQQFDSLAAGSTVRNLNIDLVSGVKIPLLPIIEQKRIVAILDQAFADIEQARANTEQNLKKSRELFESYLQQVFSRFGAGLKQVPLSEITNSISDGDHSAPPKSESGVPFITISNINKSTNQVDFSNTFSVPEEYFANLKPTRKPIIGDVLYTVTGSYGIPVLVRDEKDFCFQRHIGLVRPNEDVDSKWLYYLLMSPQVFNQADSGATGTAQKTVSLKLLRGISVPNIPMDIQKEMVEGLDLMYEKSKSLEQVYDSKLRSLDELKKSILQKAFSGELTKDSN